MGGTTTLYKLVILGDGGVGKTALVNQVSLEHFSEIYDPTIEDCYRKQVVIDGQECILEILDTAGQEGYTALRDQWIRDGECFVLVYSINSASSFNRIQSLYHQIRRVKEAAHLVSTYPNSLSTEMPKLAETPIMLVGNKADRVTERTVSILQGQELAQRLGTGFVEASAKNGRNVEKAFYDLIRLLRRQQQQGIVKRPAAHALLQQSSYQSVRSFWGLRKIYIRSEEMSTGSGRSRLVATLVSAAKSNNERLVLAYLEAGVDVNAHTGTDGSALHASAAAGHANIVNILLKKGAAINALGPTSAPSLQFAAAEGHLAVVRLLVHEGAAIDQTSSLHGTALSAAASRGRADIVRFLLKKGASASVAGGPYGNALQAASWNGNPDVIRYLLDSGADIRARGGGGCTALQMAAFVGKASAIQVLDRGARVDIDAPGGKYGSALKAATEGNHYEAVTLLLEAGATPLQLGRGETDGSETGDGEELAPNHDSNGPSQKKNITEMTLPGHIASPIELPTAISLTVDERNMSFQPISIPILSPRLSYASQLSTHNNSEILKHHSLSLVDRPAISSVGFSTIHDSPKATVDIVFIHGLQGHPEKTWTYAKTSHKRTSLRQRFFRSSPISPIEETPAIYWPYALLAQNEDFADTRIMTWGYDTKVIGDFFGTSDQQNISQHGNNFMVSLQQERKANPHRPLVFVAHSLGGIILKVALDNSKRSIYQPQYLSIYESTKGIIFLGTPHGGSGGADWGLITSKIIKCALQSPSERVLRSLTPNSELLENLRKTFLQMLEDDHFKIHSFHETRPIYGIYGLNSLVVPYESSQVGHARKEVVLGLPGNHSEICKFSGPADPAYKAVFGALQDYVTEATNRPLIRHVRF